MTANRTYRIMGKMTVFITKKLIDKNLQMKCFIPVKVQYGLNTASALPSTKKKRKYPQTDTYVTECRERP